MQGLKGPKGCHRFEF